MLDVVRFIDACVEEGMTHRQAMKEAKKRIAHSKQREEEDRQHRKRRRSKHRLWVDNVRT